LCLIDARGAASFYRLMAEMRTRWPNEQQMMFLAFDLLHQDGLICWAYPCPSASAISTDSAARRACCLS